MAFARPLFLSLTFALATVGESAPPTRIMAVPNLKSLYTFSKSAPLSNEINGVPDAILYKATSENGIDSTDDGIIAAEKEGYISAFHGLPVNSEGYANTWTLLMDVRFTEANLLTYTGFVQLQKENKDDGDFWLRDGRAIGVSNHMYTSIDGEFKPFVWYRFVFTIDLTIPRARYYMNGRLVHEAAGNQCGNCEMNGRYALEDNSEVLIFHDNDFEVNAAEITNAGFWGEELSEDVVKNMGPPDIGAADAPQCASMNLLGSFISHSLEPKDTLTISKCGSSCCSSKGSQACYLMDPRFKVDSGACVGDVENEICSALRTVNKPNLPPRYYSPFCTPHKSSPSPNMEALVALLTADQPAWHVTNRGLFFAATKCFLSGRGPVSLEDVAPELKVYPMTFVTPLLESGELYSKVQQSVYELVFAEQDVIRQKAKALAPANFPVPEKGATFNFNSIDKLRAALGADRSIPIPTTLIASSGTKLCEVAGSAVEQGSQTVLLSAGCTQTGQKPNTRTISPGLEGECKVWKRMMKDLGVTRFAFVVANYFTDKFLDLKRSIVNECFDRCPKPGLPPPPGKKNKLNDGMCADFGSEICSGDSTSGRCTDAEEALHNIKAEQYRVIVLAMAATAGTWLEFLETVEKKQMFGPEYTWIVWAGSDGVAPGGGPTVNMFANPIGSKIFNGALLVTTSCHGQIWDDFAKYLDEELDRSDLPGIDFESGKTVAGGNTYGMVLHLNRDVAKYEWNLPGAIDENLAATVDATWANLIVMNNLVKRGHAVHNLPSAALLGEIENVEFAGVCGDMAWTDGERTTATPLRVYNVRPINYTRENPRRRTLYTFEEVPVADIRHNESKWFEQPIYANGLNALHPHDIPDCGPGKEVGDDLLCHICPKGSVRSVGKGKSGMSPCTKCWPGTYSANEGESTCNTCQGGYFSAAPGASECDPCPAGSSQGKPGFCELCPKGSFTSTTGKVTCDKCSVGRFSDQLGAAECKKCPPGYFQSATGSIGCSPCSQGFYAPDSGSDACTFCPRKSFANTTASISCHDCESVLEDSTSPIGSSSESDCSCNAGLYDQRASRPPYQSSRCQKCPVGMSCSGGSSTPNVKYGYYTDSWDKLPTEAVVGEYSVFQCNGDIEERCAGGELGDSCATGRLGFHCDFCKSGYAVAKEGKCAPCNGSDLVPFVFAMLFALFALTILYTVIANEDRAKQRQSSLLVALTCSMLVMVTQNSAVISNLRVNWTEPIKSFLNLVQILTFDLDVINFGCVAGLSPVEKYSMRLISVCVLFFAIACIHFIFVVVFFQGKFKETWGILVCAMGTIMTAFFIPIVTSAVLPFQCSLNPNGLGTVIAYRSIICFESPEYFSLMTVGVIFMIVPATVLGLVAWAVRVLPSKVAAGDIKFLRSTSFLFFRFKHATYWYILVFLITNTLFASIPMLPNAVVQLLCLQALLQFSIIITSVVTPWRVMFANVTSIGTYAGLSLFLACAAFYVKDVDQTAIANVCMVLMSMCFTLLLLVLFYGLILKIKERKKRFKYFLSHHKSAAGAFARLLQMQLVNDCQNKSEVFLDCDHLQDLDGLFDFVRAQTETLVILGSKEFYTRPWCVGEVVTANITGVDVLVVALPSFVKPNEVFINNVADYIPDCEKLNVQGITVERIQQAIRWANERATLSLPEPLPVTAPNLQKLSAHLRMRNVESATISIELNTKADCDNGILVDADNLEACATALVLEQALRNIFVSQPENLACVIYTGTDVPSTLKAVAVICTDGSFSREPMLVSLLSCARQGGWFLPVVSTDDFAFPKMAVPSDVKVDLPDADKLEIIEAVQEAFKKIAVVFLARSSKIDILMLKANDVARRLGKDKSAKMKSLTKASITTMFSNGTQTSVLSAAKSRGSEMSDGEFDSEIRSV